MKGGGPMTERSQREIEQLYHRHVGTVYRVCFAYMKNAAEAEDAAHDTFIRLMRTNPSLADSSHERAWLIRTAGNVCKDMLRRRRREDIPLDGDLPDGVFTGGSGVLEAVLALPERYKTTVYLYYYEGYDSAEIAGLLDKPNATVRGHLHEARQLLKKQLGGELE